MNYLAYLLFVAGYAGWFLLAIIFTLSGKKLLLRWLWLLIFSFIAIFVFPPHGVWFAVQERITEPSSVLLFVVLPYTLVGLRFYFARSGRNKRLPDIGQSPEGADYLARELERLMALPLVTKSEIQQWYEEKNKVVTTLEVQFRGFGFYHEVWHFFADADIRARDMGYRDYQHRLMSDYVARLRNEAKAV